MTPFTSFRTFLSIIICLFGATSSPANTEPPTPPLKAYCSKLEAAIRDKWVEGPAFETLRVVDILVDRSGKIVDVLMSFGDNNPQDAEVVSAVGALSRLPPPPPEASYALKLRLELANDRSLITVAEATEAAKDVNYGPYMEDLQHRIKSGWHPPKGDISERVIVTFRIHRDGQITDIRLTKPNKSEPANQAAISAVTNTSPALPLPKGSPDSVDIEFTFDKNVFGNPHLIKRAIDANLKPPFTFEKNAGTPQLPTDPAVRMFPGM